MYPTIEQYKDAIRIAEYSLASLNDYESVLKADGEPWFSSGNFAVVFQMKHKQDGKRLALKCFTRHQDRREESYRLISQQLATIQSDYVLKYQYLDNEIWVSNHNNEGSEYPVVAMEWAEGMTLGDYVKQYCTSENKDVLKRLAHNFEVFCAWMIEQPFAHGDLKPDNIMVRNDDTLALVDYDGMYVPTMQGQQAREFGSPIYRHPKRTLHTYDRHIDDFSLLVLLSELRLIAADPSLYNSSLSGESIVAKAGDWQNSNDARIIQAMQTQFTNGTDLAWINWQAMLRITAQSDAHRVADWGMVLDKKKSIISKPIKQPTVISTSKIQLNSDFSIDVDIGIALDMIFVEGGTFMMGSDRYDDEKPIHEISLDSFWIGKFTVTEGLWNLIMSNNPSYSSINNDLPIVNITWNDTQIFIKKLNEKFPPLDRIGRYRLLTEAEWEFAAKGGNNSKGYQYAGADYIDEVAWYRENSNLMTHLIGQKKPNELGIYDMSGNVWEWCEDWHDKNYYTNSPKHNPTGLEDGSFRVLRGGSWLSFSVYCRMAHRNGNSPNYRSNDLGFRLCLGS